MNHQFTGSRSPTGGMPFYNPQKDTNPSPLFPNAPPPQPPFISPTNSKSLISRSNILEPLKPGNNTSAYIKTYNEPPKFPTSATSPTNYAPPQFAQFQPSFPKPTDMVRSSIHDNSKADSLGYPMQLPEKTPFPNPTRRAPRMSEPHQFDNPSKTYDFKPEPPATDSPGLQKRFKDPREFENHFLKNKPNGSSGQPNQREDRSSKFQGSTSGKSQPWSKSSLGRRKQFSVADFRKIKELGSGKYGVVSLVQQKSTNMICALKMIEKKLLKEEEITEQFIRELKIQLFLNHPNIIKMYGYFDDEQHIYIILEVGTGGQLYHQLRKSEPMPEAKVAPIMKQVCDAVNEIHSLRIIHRDIKPENIVIHDNVIKLCDFGWSVYLDNKMRTTFCGTPLYVCPQILKGKQYDQKIDIWSLGIMMYQMVVGENPFKITKQQELIKIVKDEISIPSYVFVSREARDFLDKCLKKNPADRVTIKELLNHQFLVKNVEKGDKKIAL